jgi:hypothetical protein
MYQTAKTGMPQPWAYRPIKEGFLLARISKTVNLTDFLNSHFHY